MYTTNLSQFYVILSCVCGMAVTATAFANGTDQGKQSTVANKAIVGWVEMAKLNHHDFPIQAKVDSGADNTSLNANHVHFEKDGKKWVRFDVTNHEGKTIKIEKPVIKTARIKKKTGGHQMRDVIRIEICLGHIKKEVNVNLVDRSHFKYQLLIGRSFLRPDFLIDSNAKYTVQPDCTKT